MNVCEHPYLYAVVKAMQDYLIEEMQGKSNADLRLTSKLEAVKNLFKDEIDELRTIYREQATHKKL